MKKKIIYRSTIIFLIIFSAFTFLYFSLPSNINLLEGTEHRLNYGFLFKYKIDNDTYNNIELESINASNDYVLKGNKNGKGKMTALIGFIPIKKVDVNVIETTKLVPSGEIAGIRIYEDGVIVLGTGNVNGEYELKGDKLLKEGDVITEINGKKVLNKDTITDEVNLSEGNNIKLKVLREGKYINIDMKPKYSKTEDKYKLGIWVRDSTQGIGTITYYNPNKKTIGMLGHPILDVDTGNMFSVRKGKILEAKVTFIKKGEKGNPGEVMGVIYDNETSNIADIKENSEFGIIANTITDKKMNIDLSNKELLEVATMNEIKIGEAKILSNIIDNEVREYDISIEEINKYDYSINKGMIIKIIDKELIEKTGGIIQGMSGSPIIQNDKIIGVVTHVFVQNPEKGFAIFIEDMLSKDK